MLRAFTPRNLQTWNAQQKQNILDLEYFELLWRLTGKKNKNEKENQKYENEKENNWHLLNLTLTANISCVNVCIIIFTVNVYKCTYTQKCKTEKQVFRIRNTI